MSEPVIDPEAPTTEQPATGDPGPDPAAQVEKWRALARKHEARAKENASAAARLAEIEEANKTAEQKAAERLAAAEARAAELELKAARAEVAAEKGVPAALLTGTTPDELAASADALLAFRADTAKPPAAPPATGLGNVGKPIGDGDQQLTKADVDRLYSERKYAEIEEARATGRLNTLLGIKTP